LNSGVNVRRARFCFLVVLMGTSFIMTESVG